MQQTFSLTPDPGGLAARVTGLDLREHLPASQIEALCQTMHTHPVLIFPAQQLDKAAQLRLTLGFGELDEHAGMNAGSDVPEVHTVSNLGPDGQPSAQHLGSQAWHSDKSYRRIPSTLTFLYAVEVPGEGGDTQFADMASAFEALEASEQARLRSLRIVHSWERSVARSGGTISDEERHKWPPVAHPLTRRLNNGRLALFMGQHASHIEGMAEDESDTLMQRLLEHATQSRFIYQHRWQPGDLVIWDNRGLLHRVLPNFELNRARRLLHRTVTRGLSPPD